MTAAQLALRTLTDHDLPAYASRQAAAFLVEDRPEWREREREVLEPERALGMFDGDSLIGGGAILTRRMTLPGSGPTAIAAVSSVWVAPDYRRRGVLRTIMRAQLHGLYETRAEPIAALWASEGGIYGRFGYGLASRGSRIAVPKGAAFRPGVNVGAAAVRELAREQALPMLRAIYDKVVPEHIGWLERGPASWEYVLHDAEPARRGWGALRFALHPQGYAVYRTRSNWGERGPQGAVSVREVAATSETGYAALWRYLLDMDLAAEVESQGGIDEPLIHLLANPDLAVRKQFNALWTRIVDVDRALAARHYGGPLELVIAVTDALCPWNAGRWALTVDTVGQATVHRTESDADLELDIADLGAVFLGGTRLTTLAAAGRVRELTPGVLARASMALLAESEPDCIEVF